MTTAVRVYCPTLTLLKANLPYLTLGADHMQPTLIAIAIVEHAGEFLIGQRPPGASLAGLWEFPGGKIEPGETPAQAAVRECWEETGLTVLPGDALPVHQESYSHGKVQLHFISCTLAVDQPPPRAPFRWVPRADLAQYEFPSGNRPLLKWLGALR